MFGTCDFPACSRVPFWSRNPRLTALRIRYTDHATPQYPQKLALPSPTSGGLRSVSFEYGLKAAEYSDLTADKQIQIATQGDRRFPYGKAKVELSLCLLN
jgi:hypothetical protein